MTPASHNPVILLAAGCGQQGDDAQVLWKKLGILWILSRTIFEATDRATANSTLSYFDPVTVELTRVRPETPLHWAASTDDAVAAWRPTTSSTMVRNTSSSSGSK
jgi:hypothetical protein